MGVPGVTAPVGYSPEGLPIAVQVRGYKEHIAACKAVSRKRNRPFYHLFSIHFLIKLTSFVKIMLYIASP